MPSNFCLSVFSTGVSSAIGVNGAPLVTDPEGKGVRATLTVNEWLLPEENRLTIFLSWPAGQPYELGQGRVETSVYLADPASTIPTPERVFVDFRWPPRWGREAYPHVFEGRFPVPVPPPTRLFGEAVTVETPTVRDKVEILEQVVGLDRALRSNDYPLAFRLTQYKFADQALAYGQDFTAVSESVLKQYGVLMGHGPYEGESMKIDQMLLVRVANGRVFLVCRPDGSDAVVIRREGGRVRIPVFVAKVDGHFRIVR